MTGVAIYLVTVLALAALLCCHQGEGAPPGARLALRVLRRPRPSWAYGPIRARHFARRTRQEPDMRPLPEPHGWPGLIVAAWPLIAAVTLAAAALRNRIRR